MKYSIKFQNQAAKKRLKEVVLTSASEKILSSNSTGNCKLETQTQSDSSEHFIVFVAGGMRPIISYSDFSRAERLALVFAGLVNERMEVFDSLKEICYFIEPSESKRPSVH